MRVQHDLQEMVRWEEMPGSHRSLCVEQARAFLLGVHGWKDVKAPTPGVRHAGGGTFEPTIEDHNGHALRRADQEILRSLNVLRRQGVPQPLVPFYVAVWQEAQGIPSDDVSGSPGLEEAIVLAMVRVQGTAMLVGAYNQAQGDETMKEEITRRGLLRR